MSHFTNLMTITNEFKDVPEDICVNHKDDSNHSEDDSEDNSECDSEADKDNSSNDSENDISATSPSSSFSRPWTVHFHPPPIQQFRWFRCITIISSSNI